MRLWVPHTAQGGSSEGAEDGNNFQRRGMCRGKSENLYTKIRICHWLFFLLHLFCSSSSIEFYDIFASKHTLAYIHSSGALAQAFETCGFTWHAPLWWYAGWTASRCPEMRRNKMRRNKMRHNYSSEIRNETAKPHI